MYLVANYYYIYNLGSNATILLGYMIEISIYGMHVLMYDLI